MSTISRKLKYLGCVSQISNCPPKTCLSVDGDFFRFVHEDLEHQNNFIPVRKINPARKLPGDPVRQCDEWALSLYDTRNNASRAYLYISKKCQNFHKTVGTHLALVSISYDDGVMDEVDETGHSNFHEYENAELVRKSVIVGSILGGSQ